MALDRPSDISENAAEPPATSDADPTAAIRQAESTLDRTEELVGEALGTEDALSAAVWQLTLAQWNLGRHDVFRRQWPRQAAMVVASVATIVYLVYRLFWTLNLVSAPAICFSIMLFAAECYAAFCLGLYFYQIWRLVEPPLCRPTPGRTVDVFITTYNEEVSLLRGTVTACVEMDYPHTTYILDDGAREEVRQLAESLGVEYISRTDRTHAKAGNLNNALRKTNGEFVVILDADHIPYRLFLTRLIGYFDDPRMGFVQAPHTTYNLDNFVGRWQTKSKAYWEDVRIFYEAVQLGKNRFNVACFCGSAAMFRRKAIEDVGLFATETITEDMHTGMRINARGWKSLAVSEAMVVGLAPDNAATFTSQRLRWGEGNLSVMAYDNPLTMKGLTLPGRINYLASILCWTMGPIRLILYLTPLIMLLSGISPVTNLSVAFVAIITLYLGTVWTAVKMASNGCGQLLGIEMALMGAFHLQTQALWRAIFRRSRQKFVVTDKRLNAKAQSVSWLKMWPQAAIVALSIIAVSWAVSRIAFGLSNDYLGLTIGTGLAVYQSALALAVLARTSAKRDPGGQWHHPLCLAVDYSLAGDDKPAVSIECNENGCHLLTWERLETGWPLRVLFHSPAGETVAHGRVASCESLGGSKSFAYLSNIVFAHADPVQRERESDALRTIILRYVVPVVTMTHHTIHEGTEALPEQLSGEADFPIPLLIDPNRPYLAIEQSVALSMNEQGFLAAIPVACEVGSIVQVALSTPLGPIAADVEVHDVEAMRIGATMVYQHQLRWRDPAIIRDVLANHKRWTRTLQRNIAQMRSRRQSTRRLVGMELAACFLFVATAFVFSESHYADIVLASAVKQPAIAVAQRNTTEVALERVAAIPHASADRLMRVYRAAVAVNNYEVAAEAALQLADRVKTGRLPWLLTNARQLSHTDNHQAADAAFDRVLAEPTVKSIPMEEQADVYVEAARAAVATKNFNKAVERFLQASTLKAADPVQAEELLGVLISAKQTRLAIQVLRQLDRSDRVLRRIVDVYEMANQTQKAVPELEELLRRHPDDANVTRRLAELAVSRREFNAGLNYYQALWKLEPKSENAKEKVAETMLFVARDYVAAKQFEKARTLFDESFRLYPPDDNLKREYGGLLASAGYFNQAIAILESLTDVDSRLQLAAVLEMQGNSRRALQIMLDLEKAQSLDEKAEWSIVRLLLAEQRPEEAANRLTRLIEKEPNNPTLRREFLDAVAASDHWNDAVRKAMVSVYHQYQQRDFRELDATGFERLSDALRQLGMFEEAKTALEQGIAEFPKTRRLRFNLAQTLGDLGRYDAAEAQYVQLLKTEPSQPR